MPKKRKRSNHQKVKGVAFNLANKSEKEMLEYVEDQGNFSNYIKNLIFMDMRLKGDWSRAVKDESEKAAKKAANELTEEDLEGFNDLIG